MTVLEQMSFQANKPGACSDYRLRSTKLMGTIRFHLFAIIYKPGGSFWSSASTFQFMFEGFSFFLCNSTFSPLLFRSDNMLFTCMQLSDASRHTWIFSTSRGSDQSTDSFAGIMFGTHIWKKLFSLIWLGRGWSSWLVGGPVTL